MPFLVYNLSEYFIIALVCDECLTLYGICNAGRYNRKPILSTRHRRARYKKGVILVNDMLLRKSNILVENIYPVT